MYSLDILIRYFLEKNYKEQTSVQSTVGWPTSGSHLDIPKNDNGKFHKMEGGVFHLKNSAG